MFLGHFAVGFALKRVAPRVSLGTLFIAVQLQDLLWPLFLLLGFEHVRIDPGNTAVTPLDFYDYPFSHSLPGAALLAVIFGGAFVLVLLGIFTTNILDPAPPGSDVIAIAGNAMWLFVVAAWWIDRNREVRLPQNAGR